MRLDSMVNTPKRILVLRSASVPIVHRALETLRARWPESRLDLLCQPSFMPEFQTQPVTLIPYTYEQYSVDQLNSTQGKALQDSQYDLVVIVYSNQRGGGYQNVHDFACGLDTPQVIAINKDGDWMDPDHHHSKPDSWETQNNEKLSKYRNIHPGRRAFILGMGPSLRIDDLQLLEHELCFACNKIYLGFNDTSWRPSCYSVIDILVAQNNREKINALTLPSIHEMNLRPILGDAEHISYVKTLKNPGTEDDPDIQFSTDITTGVYGGRTVLFFQLQLAFFMGVREIYLLGLDFDFQIPNATAEKTAHGETVLVHNGEQNHFHADYRAPGERWSMPNMEVQRKAFIRAREHFAKNDGIIINASRRTKLDVFPRARLEDIISA